MAYLCLRSRVIPIIIMQSTKGKINTEQVKKLFSKEIVLPKKKDEFFTNIDYLREDRICVLYLKKEKKFFSQVKFEKEELTQEVKSYDTIISGSIIFNSEGYLELVGFPSQRYSLIRDIAETISDILEDDFFKFQISTSKQLEVVKKANASKIAYYDKRFEENILIYLTHPKDENIKEIRSFISRVPIGDRDVAYNFNLFDGKMLLYNFLKRPLSWEEIFKILDDYIYPIINV